VTELSPKLQLVLLVVYLDEETMKPDRNEIISSARFTVRPENRKELCLTISSLVGLIKGEGGCRAYRFYGEAEHQDSYLLIGEWDTKEAWDHHLKSDNFAVLVGSLKLLGDRADVDFKLLSHVTGIEAQTKARCDPHKERPLIMLLN
jgi:quinol monooxygenase YgiN